MGPEELWNEDYRNRLDAAMIAIHDMHKIITGYNGMPGVVTKLNNLEEEVKIIKDALKDIQILSDDINEIPGMNKRLLRVEQEILGVDLTGKEDGIKYDIMQLKNKPKKSFGIITKVFAFGLILISMVGGILGIIAFFF